MSLILFAKFAFPWQYFGVQKNLVPCLCGGSGSEAKNGDGGKEALHNAEELVVRAKVVAPLAAAVYLVDRQAGEDPGLVARLITRIMM